MAQLNIRMRLESEGKEVSVIAEKMAYGGVTRFEDLKRLPLGMSVNFTSFSAKMLAFLVYYPKLLVPYFSLGQDADITVCLYLLSSESTSYQLLSLFMSFANGMTYACMPGHLCQGLVMYL
jgi:hypothetical protein